jgi:hypothetical protein
MTPERAFIAAAILAGLIYLLMENGWLNAIG